MRITCRERESNGVRGRATVTILNGGVDNKCTPGLSKHDYMGLVYQFQTRLPGIQAIGYLRTGTFDGGAMNGEVEGTVIVRLLHRVARVRFPVGARPSTRLEVEGGATATLTTRGTPLASNTMQGMMTQPIAGETPRFWFRVASRRAGQQREVGIVGSN